MLLDLQVYCFRIDRSNECLHFLIDVCENQLIIYDNEISLAVISAPEKRFKDNEINHNLTFQLAKKQIEKLEELKNCFLARYFIMPEVFFRDLRSYKIRLVINYFAIVSLPLGHFLKLRY